MPLRSRLIAYYPLVHRMGISFSSIYNFLCTNKFFSCVLKKILGFSTKRSLPTVASHTFYSWSKKYLKKLENPVKTLYFFVDEFTNTSDVRIGIKAVKLLEVLRYQIVIVRHAFSGRTFLSKGMLKKTKKLANENVALFSRFVTEETPLIGIEPSAILAFKDEYPELVDDRWKPNARKLAKHCQLIDEFINAEFEQGHISSALFNRKKQEILFHSHCYQKALSVGSCCKY